MSSYEKLIQQVLNGKRVSYKDAERILLNLGFELEIRGSHHTFRKEGYKENISLKRRPELLSYQLKLLQSVLEEHDYEKK